MKQSAHLDQISRCCKCDVFNSGLWQSVAVRKMSYLSIRLWQGLKGVKTHAGNEKQDKTTEVGKINENQSMDGFRFEIIFFSRFRSFSLTVSILLLFCIF